MEERERIGAALPAYDIGVELGRGAWGVVYSARHRSLGRDAAVKQLPRAFAADPKVRERFAAEARLAASLEHPHIVPVYDFVDDEGMCLIVMERCNRTLSDRFHTEGLATDEACAALLALCAGLGYAHSRNVLHRDIKPENLMYSDADLLKLGDFGIARALDSSTRLTATGTVMGTPAYMSPEQATGEDLTPASDIYSAGVLFYELLSGELPFGELESIGAMIRAHLVTPPRPLQSVAPLVPGPIAAVVERSLAKAPEDRYASAEAFGVAIAEAASAAFGPGWLRARRFPLLGATEITAATERDMGGTGRAGTVVVRGHDHPTTTTPPTSDDATAATVAAPPVPADAEHQPTVASPAGVFPPSTAAPPSGADGAEDRAKRRSAGPGRSIAVAVAVVVALGAVIGVVAATGGGGDEESASEEPAGEDPTAEDPASGEPAAEQPAGPPGVGALRIGAIVEAGENDEDQLVAIRSAIDDINAAGGVDGQAVTLVEPGFSAADVTRLVGAGATVIVGPSSVTDIDDTVASAQGAATVISARDFFDRPQGPASGYYRTKPRLEHARFAIPDRIADDGPVVIVQGGFPISRNGRTAEEIQADLVARGTTVEVLARDTEPADVAAAVTAAAPATIVFIGFVGLDDHYQALFDAGITPATTRFLALGGDGWAGGFDDGALTGIEGLDLDFRTGNRLEERVPGGDFGSDAAQAYDATIIAALAAEATGSTASADIAAALPDVTAGGEVCTDYGACLALLAEGADIDYDGPSGPLEIDAEDGRPNAALVRSTVLGPTILDTEVETIVVRRPTR